MKSHNETLVKAILRAYSEGRKSFDGFALTEQTAGTETQKQTYRELRARKIAKWIEDGVTFKKVSKKKARKMMGEVQLYLIDGEFYVIK